MSKKLSLTIAMPTYNGSQWIKETIRSILSQNLTDFKMIVSDDSSTDDTVESIKSFKDRRIKIHRNPGNLGYGANLQVLRKMVDSDLLFLMAQDDFLLKDALRKTHDAFFLDKDIGAVTRPFYWFDEDSKRPVRAIMPYDREKDRVISVFDGPKEVRSIFGSVGQLSGLAYRVKNLDRDFHTDTFPAHIYPFASITKKHKVVFLKDYTVAVRIKSSQTRFKSGIYDISPTESWVRMFKDVYQGERYEKVRKTGIDQITTHYIGLVQIKNYGSFKNLLKEILILAKQRPRNLFNLGFWFCSLGTIIIPRKFLRLMVDNYKEKILSLILKLRRIKP